MINLLVVLHDILHPGHNLSSTLLSSTLIATSQNDNRGWLAWMKAYIKLKVLEAKSKLMKFL